MANKTTDHTEIKDWVERRGGWCEKIDDPEAKHNSIGIRINFPGPEDDLYYTRESHPKKISWKEFFSIFEEKEFAFIYDDDKFEEDPGLSYWFESRNVA